MFCSKMILIEDGWIEEQERNGALCFRLKCGGYFSGGPQTNECSFDDYLVWLIAKTSIQYLNSSTQKSLLQLLENTWALTIDSRLPCCERTAEGNIRVQSRGVWANPLQSRQAQVRGIPRAHHLEQFPIHTVARLLAGTGDERIFYHFESRADMRTQNWHLWGISLGWAPTLRWSSSELLEDALRQRRNAGKHFSFALPCWACRSPLDAATRRTKLQAS